MSERVLSGGYRIVDSVERAGKVFVRHEGDWGDDMILSADGVFRDTSECRPIWYFDSLEDAEYGLAVALLKQGGGQ